MFGDGFMPLSALEEMPIRVAMSQSVLNVIRYLPYSLRKVKKKIRLIIKTLEINYDIYFVHIIKIYYF